MSEPHAVRWASYLPQHGIFEQWTKWHWTTNASQTICGRVIRLAIPNGSFVPETDDSIEKVTCKHCLRILESEEG